MPLRDPWEGYVVAAAKEEARRHAAGSPQGAFFRILAVLLMFETFPNSR